MKMRKLFAGLAAAATLLGGLALGAGTASAAETITLNPGATGVVNGHTYKFVELAKYAAADSQQVETVDAAKTAVTAAIKTATTKDVPAGTDPIVWAQSGDLNGTGKPLFGDNSAFPWSGNAASRAFADALVKYATDNGTDATADAEPYALSVPEGGLYLIVDTTAAAEGTTQKSLPIIVGTANKAFGFTGSIDVKNQLKQVPPTKSVTGDTDGTVSVGDTLTYTIDGTVPSTTNQGDDYTYVFNDTASAGLSIDTSTVKVTVEGVEAPLAADQYTVNPAGQTVTGNGKDVTFSVTLTKAALDKLQAQAGKKLSVTYTATVTADAKKNPVTNSAEVNNGGQASGKGTTVTLHSNAFSFKKQWADGTVDDAIAKAVFEVTDANGAKVATISPDAKTGQLSFDGLKNGTYTVKETTVAQGATNVTGSFKVTLTWDAKANKTTVTFDDKGLDPYDLVKQDAKTGAITVTNVKSIAQLPLTGAAGIGLFAAVAVLLAGAGAAVFGKTRSTKRMLNA